MKAKNVQDSSRGSNTMTNQKEIKRVNGVPNQASDSEIVPKAYELEYSDPRFTFKNFFIEYGRFHQDET